MENNQFHSRNNVRKLQGEVKHFKEQERKVFEAFKRMPSTMLMVDFETNVMRSNICYYVGKWKQQGRMIILYKGICPITKRSGVQFLTTNPDLFPKRSNPSNTVKPCK